MELKFYKQIMLLGVLLFGFSQAIAQTTVTGKVTMAEDGSPLPGVNILVKGTTAGTVTDIDGNYRISVPEGENVLSYSFIGYQTQEIEANGRSTINVTLLSDSKQLSEVVVTAVNIEREKRALGYAVTNLEGEKLAQ